VINTLLRFICLTLPICAGIEFKTLSKEEKQRRSTKANSPWWVKGDQWRVKGEQVPESTRNHSPSTRKGEKEASELAMASEKRAPKASNSREHQFSHALNSQWRMEGDWIYSRGELGRLKLLRGDVAQTHWWRNLNLPRRMKLLARRVDADQNFYKSPLDHFT